MRVDRGKQRESGQEASGCRLTVLSWIHLGGLVGRGSEARGAGPRKSGLSEGVVKEPSFSHRGGRCGRDLQTVLGLQSQRPGTTGQGAHRARAALSDR